MGSLHNEIKYGGALGQAALISVGVNRDESGIERLGETLTPIVNLWERPEWSLPRRELLLSAFANVGPVAAEFGGMALVNEAGSQALLVIEAIGARSSAAAAFAVSIQTKATILGTYTSGGNSAQVRDTRKWDVSDANSSVGLWTGTDPAVFSNTLEDVLCPGTTLDYGYSLCAPWIIAPGRGICCVCTTANITAVVKMRARWRVVLPGELPNVGF